MSKKMTPCENLGYKVGDKFKASKSGAWFSVGEEVELGRDDGSHYPYFFNERMPKDGDGGWPRHVDSVEKISNAKLKPAKQALADAIHQNGGWGVGMFAVYGKLSGVCVFCDSRPRFDKFGHGWWASSCGEEYEFKMKPFVNWHQCILSRDEYFTAYPEKVKVEINNETKHEVEVEMTSESEMTIKVSDWHKNGELPPVGEVCEAYIDYPPQWIETEIVAHKDGFAIGWCKSVMKGCHGDKAHEFRPLRSEREKAIDEMMAIASTEWGSLEDVCGVLYMAGYRKEIK